MKLNVLVKEIIENNEITTQEEITDILLKKYNKKITQSNISRILKQINAVKIVSDNKKAIYQIQDKLVDISKLAKNLVKRIEDNGNVILIKSYPGSGQIIGQALDEQHLDDIMGTVSGDNTTMIIPKIKKKKKKLRLELEKILLK